MVLIGYAYGVRELYRFGFYVPLSPLSAIAFIELSVALMFIHAERGFMRLFVGQTLGSKMVRWLLPTLILVFITIGWLCRQGNLMHWYKNQFEVSMLIFLTLFLSSCLIIWQARAQHGQELLRQRAQFALELNNINLEKKVELRTQELKKLMEELEALSLTDSLTGLANRRAFEQRLKMEWQRATRYEHPLTIMLIDVDHFKRFNDDFGHQTGDHVLAQVGTILQQAVRTTDLACRYGGEEFVIILPDTSLDDAMPIAHRIREQVANYAWEARQVTVSVGVSMLNQQETANQLVSDADQALYQAKAAGRNQVIYLA
jgi:diguanylate cyclase (GGDEF)-like protein